MRFAIIATAALIALTAFAATAGAVDCPYDPHAWDGGDPDGYNPSDDLGIFNMTESGFDMTIKTIAEDPDLDYIVQIARPGDGMIVVEQNINPGFGEVQEYPIHVPTGPVGTYEIHIIGGDPRADRPRSNNEKRYANTGISNWCSSRSRYSDIVLIT